MSEALDPYAKIQELQAELEAYRQAEDRRARGRSKRIRVRVTPPRRGRDRGNWCLRIYGREFGESGRRELTEFPADEKHRKAAESVALVRQARLNSEGLMVLEIFAQWLDYQSARVCSGTFANYTSVRDWLTRTPHAALRDPLRGSDVLALQDDLFGDYKASTARLYFGCFRRAWRWAHARDLVKATWPDLPRRSGTREDKCQKRALSEEELRDLLDFLASYRGGWALPLGWALAETACRVGELVVLEVRDALPQAGGGALLRIGHRVPTKTGEPRTALVSPPLAELLDLARDPLEPLFPSLRAQRSGERRAVARGTFGQVVRRWARKVGLEGKRDIHSFRRRGAVALHTAGVPVELAKRVTGHEDAASFLLYANRGAYDVDAERRLLWVQPPAAPAETEQADDDEGQDLEVGAA